ncbi:putative ABC transporter permease [Enterococcus casseliflavus]|uniref:putative ABC transporter permease n=1 Tax=Enterococcus casseliflavus TaxID=37734 RepID=UPI002DBFF650|nr:putative ABC transporter permease [Enterococcus casseliflavus]MEB8418892.1 putative ABC transporter permease [Enterococcus casseliflavus]
MVQFERIILLFLLYSFIGWLWETIYCSIKAKHFVYRGFLIGPITPIYGFGILGVVYLLRPLHEQVIPLFFAAALLVTVLEYVTSYLLERFFHASWWDYKEVPLNINGRVALPISLFWGVCCVLIVRFVHPQMLEIVQTLSARVGFLLPVFLLMVLSFDMGYTLANLVAFQKAVQQVNQAFEQHKKELAENIEQYKNDWQGRFAAFPEEWRVLKQNLPRLNFHQRRLLKNFQKLEINQIKSSQELSRFIEAIRKKK